MFKHVPDYLQLWSLGLSSDGEMWAKVWENKRVKWELEQKPIDALGIWEAITYNSDIPYELMMELSEPKERLLFHTVVDKINNGAKPFLKEDKHELPTSA